MKQMTPAAVERAMKLEDVMLRAMAKRITWYQAAEILGSVADRCCAGRRDISTKGMTGCSTGGEAYPHQSGFRWDRGGGAAVVSGAILLISTCATSTRTVLSARQTKP